MLSDNGGWGGNFPSEGSLDVGWGYGYCSGSRGPDSRWNGSNIERIGPLLGEGFDGTRWGCVLFLRLGEILFPELGGGGHVLE